MANSTEAAPAERLHDGAVRRGDSGGGDGGGGHGKSTSSKSQGKV